MMSYRISHHKEGNLEERCQNRETKGLVPSAHLKQGNQGSKKKAEKQ
jgi:hypothetical protein